VAALVERLHSLTPGWLLAGEQWKAFLYITTQRRVVGFLVAEPLRQAYRVAVHSPAAAVAAQEADSQAPAAAAVAAAAAAKPSSATAGVAPAAAAAGGGGGGEAVKSGIWRGLHSRQQTHAQQGLSGGGAASSMGSGGTGATGRGADSCPSALLTSAHGLELSSPRNAPPAAAAAPSTAGPSGRPAAAAACGATVGTSGSTSRVLEIDRSRPVRATVGVRMVWVSPDMRRRGVASRLLDAARSNMVQCYVAPRAQLAFTHPTEGGVGLAGAYVGPQGWLIYGV
jgi:hypothetical protein